MVMGREILEIYVNVKYFVHNKFMVMWTEIIENYGIVNYLIHMK